MCGIVFADTMDRARASKAAFRRYQSQAGRGRLGFGCVSVSQKKINKVYRSVDESGIRKVLGDKSSVVLFHHRFPTSTPNVEECTHPIYVSNELLKSDYYVAHNGIISNDKELKENFEKLGFKFNTQLEEFYKIKDKFYPSQKIKFNDSESFAIDLALSIEEGKKDTKSRGSIAFVALQVNKESQKVEAVFFGRNTNPLKMQKLAHSFMLASEGEGEDVLSDKLYSYDLTTKTVAITDLCIGKAYVDSSSITIHVPPSTSTSSQRYGRIHDISKSNGKNRHATNDVLKSLGQQGKGERTDGCIMTKNEKGVSVLVNYKYKYNFLEHTLISKDSVGYILHAQWEWYYRILKDRKEIIEELQKPTITSSEKANQVSRIRANNLQLNTFSEVVNEMIARKKLTEISDTTINNKF